MRFEYFLVLGLLSGQLNVYGQTDSVDVWISKIDNNQLQGTCHYYWTIELKTDAWEAHKLLNAGRMATDKLIKSLSNVDKGVISHYMLSKILESTFQIETLSMDNEKVSYRVNGLEFYEGSDGIVVLPEELEKARTYWSGRKKHLSH